jgi:hypothetical protein
MLMAKANKFAKDLGIWGLKLWGVVTKYIQRKTWDKV